MIKHLKLVRFAIVVGISSFLAATSHADYVLNGSGTFRITNDGSLVGYYIPPPEEVEETYGEDFVVTPDLQTVYQFTNALGYSNIIFAFDVDSRAHLPDETLHSGSCCFPDADGDVIINPRMSLIRPNDPLGKGDLFTISSLFGYPMGALPQLKRYNRATDSYVESISPPTPQLIHDFTFGPDNRLYMAAEEGIFVYEESPAGFELVSSTPLIAGVEGTIAFGPDGRLYVRNAATKNVDRYTTLGALVDTFIPGTEIPGGSGITIPVGSIQFGVDGNLHLQFSPTGDFEAIGRFDGATGSLLGIAPLDPDNLYAVGRLTYLPVPEPSSGVLLIFATTLLAGSRSRR